MTNFRNRIDRAISDIKVLAKFATTCMEHGVYSHEIGHLEFLRKLDKPVCGVKKYTLTTTIDYDDYNQPNINCQEAIFLADWKLGDRVKVTMEKI